MENRFSERLEKVTELLNECNDFEERKLLEIEQEAWRSLNAMFVENNRELLKRLKDLTLKIEKQDRQIEGLDRQIEEKTQLIKEKHNQIGELHLQKKEQ